MSGTAGANSIVKVLGDSSIKEDLRLKAAQELAETFDNNVNCPGYPNFLDGAMKTFLKVLQEGEPHFFSDFNIQQVRWDCSDHQEEIQPPITVILDAKADSRDDPPPAGIGNRSTLRQEHFGADAEIAENG